jgi:transposase
VWQQWAADAAALIAGERDPKRLSALALGRLRHKLPQLELALAGPCTVHHGRLIQGALNLIALLEQQIADLDQHIGALVTPLQPQLAQLDSIPGVDRIAAREIIAEIRVDMRRFGSAGRFAAWARVSPGNHERAGSAGVDAPAKAIGTCGASWSSVPGRPAKRRRFWGGHSGASKGAWAKESGGGHRA